MIICGIASLLKGIKGKWDQNVKPEDMVGPSGSFDTHDGPNKIKLYFRNSDHDSSKIKLYFRKFWISISLNS